MTSDETRGCFDLAEVGCADGANESWPRIGEGKERESLSCKEVVLRRTGMFEYMLEELSDAPRES